MMGRVRAMQAMEAIAEADRMYYESLENRLEGEEKTYYEQLKSEIIEKNKKTWRKAKLVGLVGILTIASGIPLAIKGCADTPQSLDEQTTRQEYTENQDKNSFEEYTNSRSPYLNYAWLGILGGNVICAAGFITGRHIMGERARPLRDYLEKHATKTSENLEETTK